MLENLIASLAVRQLTALRAVPAQLGLMAREFLIGNVQKGLAALVALVQLIGVVALDYPGPILGDSIDMSAYELEWSDEFNGSSLDKTAWETCVELGTGEIFDESMMSFDGENMIISTEYKEDGSKGAGWYTYGIENTDAYSNFGPGCYYEVRCKVPAAKGMWSAFWMMTDGNKKQRQPGEYGQYRFTEVDVMESFYWGEKHPNSTINTVHEWLPDEQRFESVRVGKYRIGADPYEEYVTYGVLWTESEFIFYINGKESGRTDNGATTDPMFMLLTVQVDLREGENSLVLENDESAFPSYFTVDYVRVYKAV